LKCGKKTSIEIRQRNSSNKCSRKRCCDIIRILSYKDEAALLRELGATVQFTRNPEWPVLGPPQGIEEDIWPLGDSRVYAPFYTHDRNSNN
jgi:hypothetical protein